MKFRREVFPFVKQIEFPYLSRVFNNEGKGVRIPVPLPVADGKIYSPKIYLKTLALFKRWNCARLSNGHILIRPINLELTFHLSTAMFNEWGIWNSCYIPERTGIRGRTVLDAGAGCGETAYLFLSRGAKEVISIEPDPERFEVLRRNIEKNGWNVRPIKDILRPEHLAMKFDFAKIDIELGDVELLKLSSLPPCVVEVHWPEVIEAFVRKFHMRKLWGNKWLALLTNV